MIDKPFPILFIGNQLYNLGINRREPPFFYQLPRITNIKQFKL